MAAYSWKSLSLPGVILLIALGLQAGALKIMMNLNQPDEPALLDAHLPPKPSTPTESPPMKPAANITDPPPLATPQTPSVPAHETPSPEAALTTHSAAPSPEAALTTHSASSSEAALTTHSAAPSPEAALPAHNPMVSNIPPPIELDPAPSEEHSPVAETLRAASAEAALATAASPAKPTASSTLLESDWLKGRDSKRYTVQLYSGKDMNKLREIAESITGAAPPAYFVTTSRSGPWYSLVVGDYPDFTAAQTVATQIATQAPALKPWIRRFSEIQAKMR